MSSDRGYLPIEDYGLIGNLHTTALVARTDASVDFMCLPFCDSPTVFARLLDVRRGGYFQIRPVNTEYHAKQLYLPSSNVLQTKFSLREGIGQVTDLLPVFEDCQLEDMRPEGTRLTIEPWLIRKIDVIRGCVEFSLACQPAIDYGRIGHAVCLTGEGSVRFASSWCDLELQCFHSEQRDEREDKRDNRQYRSLVWNCDTDAQAQPGVNATVTLCEKESIILVLRRRDENEPQLSYLRLQHVMTATNRYWHDWIAKSTYKGRWREMVHRSALVLKLLTFHPTGAIIASPTFSIPEAIGGRLNWDYRFVWIRDAAFTAYAFMRIGLTEEATRFMEWIEARCERMDADSEDGLRILYDVHGGHPSFAADQFLEESASVEACSRRVMTQYAEIELEHWEGYRGSRPVRIGNDASQQDQLDIYGELMDAIYLCDKYCRPISHRFWCIVRKRIVEHVLVHWRDPDHGIWEVRGAKQHYVYSKVMCWVCLDRAVRLAVKHSLPGRLDAWRETRDVIYEDIMTCGWNETVESFVQHYGSNALDAANLIMPLVFFISPTDPKFLNTLQRTLRRPEEGGLVVNHLVFRYNQAAAENEGTFSICTFWLAEALAMVGKYEARYVEEAVVLFEDMIGYANHLGLFSEEIDLSGRATGNFPQALTHLALISAAFRIDRVLQ